MTRTPGMDPRALALDAFRTAMRRHAAGVCLITGGAGDTLNGMAVTSATSFSMDPPSVLVCLNQDAGLTPLVRQTGRFGLTILGAGHAQIAARFSRKPSGSTRFDEGDWTIEDGRMPSLADAVANLSCVIEGELVFATHVALIGRVIDVDLGKTGASLIYRDGAYL